MNNSYDKREILVSIACELSGRGWTIQGFKENRSDSMTDYYDPASWNGYAIKGDYLIGQTYSQSERPIYEQQDVDKACWRCKGTGKVQQGDHDTQGRTFYLLGHGMQEQHEPATLAVGDTCPTCKGQGHHIRNEAVVVGNHPKYEGPAHGQSWSLERKQADGSYRRVTQGRLYDLHKNRDHVEQATKALVDQMEHPTRPRTEPAEPSQQSVSLLTGAIVRKNDELGGVEIAFASKPEPETLAKIKSHGFRWSSRAKVWYAKYSPAKWIDAHQLAGLPAPVNA